MKKMTGFLLAVLLSTGLAGSLGAAEPQSAAQTEDMNMIGGGVYIEKTAYEGRDVKALPIPILKGRNEKFFIDGIRGGWIVVDEDRVRVDVIASPRLMGYDADDSNALEGMENRHYSFDGGAQVTYTASESDDVYVTVRALTDLLNEYGGQEGTIKLSKKFEGSFFQFIPAVGVEWQSKTLVNYYYGVRDNETKASRPAYKGDETWNYVTSLGFNMGLSRSKDVFLVTRLDADFLGKDIKKSPIVNKNMIVGGLVSVVVKF